jgi:hypothetical protein
MITSILVATLLLLFCTPHGPIPSALLPASADGAQLESADRLDARAFFDRLVARYRDLASYSDLTSVVQITRNPSGESDDDDDDNRSVKRVESRLICDVMDGELRITTPGSQLRDQVRDALGLHVRINERPLNGVGAPPVDGDQPTAIESEPAQACGSSPIESNEPSVGSEVHVPGSEVNLTYQLWLAPHMVLKFRENPLADFRAGVAEPFTPTEASPVMIDDRVLVHLALKSGAPGTDGASADFDAKFDLYVNPESMLIERIEGQQRLPDGGSFETSLRIAPVFATSASTELSSPKAADETRSPVSTDPAPALDESSDDNEAKSADEEVDAPATPAQTLLPPAPVQKEAVAGGAP